MSDKLTREERETHIWFNEADDTMEVFTESAVMIRKLKRIAPAYGVEVQDAGFHGARVSLPQKALTLRKPRILTPEQRQKLTERGQRLAESMKK